MFSLVLLHSLLFSPERERVQFSAAPLSLVQPRESSDQCSVQFNLKLHTSVLCKKKNRIPPHFCHSAAQNYSAQLLLHTYGTYYTFIFFCITYKLCHLYMQIWSTVPYGKTGVFYFIIFVIFFRAK